MAFRGLVPTLFVLLLLIWGYSWVLLKLALENAAPITFAAQRTFFGALVLLAVLPITGRPFWPSRLKETLILGLVQTTIFVTLSQLSLVDGGVGRAAILIFAMPFWTVLFASWFLGERLIGVQRVAVVLAAIGVVAILEPWQLAGTLKSKLIAISAGATWAASTVIAKRIQNRAAIDLVSLTAWQMFFGSLLIALIATAAAEPATNYSSRFIAILAFTAVVPTGLGWLVWLYLLRHLSAGVTSMGTLAIPVLATASSAIQFGERMRANEYLGMALVVSALMILSSAAFRAKKGGRRKEREVKP